MITIQGKQFEADAMDADFMERFEAAQEKLAAEGRRQLEEYAANPGIRMSARIRRECGSIFDFFDAVLGEGTARAIFGERTNLSACLDAAEELIGAVVEMQEAYNKRVDSYSPDRLTKKATAGK